MLPGGRTQKKADWGKWVSYTPTFENTLVFYRVYPVMENLEKSWNFIFFFQAWKVMEIWLQVLEISTETARFSSSFKSITSTEEYWYVQHENRNRFHLCHHILFKLTPNHTCDGMSHLRSLPRYMSLSCYKSSKRSLNF